jgi:uncharacterized membrane protein
MSDRVPGNLGRRLAGRFALILGMLAIVAGPAAPLAGAANGLTVTTPYPAVVADAGSTASFKLTVDVTAARTVNLKATGVPSGWTARFRGGGLVVDSVFVDPKTPPDLTLDVEVPDGTPAGTTNITVEATSGGLTDSLPLSIRIATAAAGDVTLTSDFPELKGPSSTTFTFNLTLKNGTPAEETFTMDASGPDGWTVSAKPATQSQAASAIVQPGSSTAITVTATPDTNAAADTYPIHVTATGGGKTAELDLSVVITGSYTMTVSSPSGVLSTSANAGSEKDMQLTVTNNGTAPITNVKLSASAPTDWKVTFDPDTIPSLAPGATAAATVTAKIIPTGDAIAGDYELTMTATGTEANDSATIRVTVETPQFWWIVGIVLIVAVFAGLYWVFRTYGRR